MLGTLRWAVVVFAIFVALTYAGVEIAVGTGALTQTGAEFDAPTGTVLRVLPGSPAAVSGLRAGDVVDYARAGWSMHFWLNRGALRPQQRVMLPYLRDGQRRTATLVGPAPKPDANEETLRFMRAAASLLYAALGVALFLLRRSAPALVFLILAVSQAAASHNTDLFLIAAPAWAIAATFAASITPTGIAFSYLYFGMIFAAEHGRLRSVMRSLIVVFTTVIGITYLAHFAQALSARLAFLYPLFSLEAWIANVLAMVVITTRTSKSLSPVRLRWVAVALWVGVLFQASFLIEQNVITNTQSSTRLDYVYGLVLPAVLGIGYALLGTRIVDVRLVGGKTLVYAVLTAIPIGLFSIVDWLFSRTLTDARFATIVEFAVAVLFGVSLNVLHRRIDRFVERVLFASRHRAFQRLRHAIHALPSAELASTVYDTLTVECASALRLASAAVFVLRDGTFERGASIGWDGCATQLSLDDPLVWFARSTHRSTHLPDVAPTRSPIPTGDAAPQIAVPVLEHHAPAAVVLYGSHENGEPIDQEEEDLLAELAHVAGTALERLEASELLRAVQAENEMLRRRIPLHGMTS